MPSTVASVSAAAGLEPAGVERWATALPETSSGVYVVALTREADVRSEEALATAPLSDHAVERLLAVRHDVRVNGRPATVELLAERLRRFWLADEVVTYIGLTSRCAAVSAAITVRRWAGGDRTREAGG